MFLVQQEQQEQQQTDLELPYRTHNIVLADGIRERATAPCDSLAQLRQLDDT